jgi:hypothetical protein
MVKWNDENRAGTPLKIFLKIFIAFRAGNRHLFSCLGSGRSVAWLARLFRVQEVVSSNLTAPTIFIINHLRNHDGKLQHLVTTHPILSPVFWAVRCCLARRATSHFPAPTTDFGGSISEDASCAFSPSSSPARTETGAIIGCREVMACDVRLTTLQRENGSSRSTWEDTVLAHILFSDPHPCGLGDADRGHLTRLNAPTPETDDAGAESRAFNQSNLLALQFPFSYDHPTRSTKSPRLWHKTRTVVRSAHVRKRSMMWRLLHGSRWRKG